MHLISSLRWNLASAALFLAVVSRGLAQVHCSLAVESGSHALKAGDSLIAKVTVTLDPGWHIYPLQEAGDNLPTVIELGEKLPFRISGPITGSPEPKDSAYAGEVTFTVPLKATAAAPSGEKLSFLVTYQACNDQSCRAPVTVRVGSP